MSDHTEKYGKWMAGLAVVAIIGVLTLLFSNEIERARNPNRAVESLMYANGEVTVALDRNRMGHYVATGYINGEPVELLVDTGATAVAVSEDVARDAGLERGYPHQVMTANGTATAYMTRIDTLDLGEIRMRNVEASITPGMRNHQVLLGMSFLRDLDFSQRNGTLRITGPAR